LPRVSGVAVEVLIAAVVQTFVNTKLEADRHIDGAVCCGFRA
jgi:hypothetical protein